MMRTSQIAASAFVLCSLMSPVQADLLNAGDTMCIDFTVSSSLSNVPDLLVLGFGLVTVNSPYTARNAALYDGNTLLGIDTKTSFGGHTGLLSLNPSNGFVDASSLWTFKGPAVVNFASIQNGTINGHIEFTINTGQMDIPLGQVTVRLGQGAGGSSYFNTTPDPVITSVSITAGGGCAENTGAPGCDCSGGNPSCFTSSAVGSGCPNTAGGGAVLTGSGNADTGADTFGLSVAGCPAGVAGLVLSGLASIGPVYTVADSAGGLCSGGTTQRGNVYFTDGSGAANMPTFDTAIGGGAYGAASGTGFQTYQFWYRDPGGAAGCSTDTGSGDFNFSNGWDVTWL